MVLLTMSATMVDAIREYQKLGLDRDVHVSEPSLSEPAVGKPIGHGQAIDISRALRAHDDSAKYYLDSLLRGSFVYVEPPVPKPEASTEYKALMARLRRDEEARAYASMISPPPPSSNPYYRLVGPEIPISGPGASADEDDMTFADINRQLALVINVLVSIFACGAAIWIVARHWSVPLRLATSMVGGGVVGVAEVVIYAAYVRKVGEAKKTERKKVERKMVLESWVIESNPQVDSALVDIEDEKADYSGARRRKKGSS